MAGTANAYGQINPQMVDPYNIEAPLAAMAADPSKQGIGLPLLALYRSERGLQSQYAAQEMQDQHKFALQKLMADQAKSAGEIINAGGQHGTLGVLATNPMTAGFLRDADPTQLWNRQDLSNREMVGKTIKDVGQGAQALTESGNPLTPGAANSVIGQGMTSPMDPLKIRTAQIAAAAKASGEDTVRTSVVTGDPSTGRQYSSSGKNLNAVLARADEIDQRNNVVPGTSGASASGSSAQPASAPQANRVQPPSKAAPQDLINRVNAKVHEMQTTGSATDKATAQAIQRGYIGGQPDVRLNDKNVPFVHIGGGQYLQLQ